MNKKIFTILVVIACVSIFVINISAKCLNQSHDKRRTVQGEETKKYSCTVQKSTTAAFKPNETGTPCCTYCGCPQASHDDTSN